MTDQEKKSNTRKAAPRKPRPAGKAAAGKPEAAAQPAAPAEKYVAPDTTKVPPGIERMRAAREHTNAAAITSAPKPATPAAAPVERKPAAPAPATPHAPAAQRRDPTRAEITERAYQIYRRRGMTPGNPEADWLQAERELREELAPGSRRKF